MLKRVRYIFSHYQLKRSYLTRNLNCNLLGNAVGLSCAILPSFNLYMSVDFPASSKPMNINVAVLLTKYGAEITKHTDIILLFELATTQHKTLLTAYQYGK